MFLYQTSVVATTNRGRRIEYAGHLSSFPEAQSFIKEVNFSEDTEQSTNVGKTGTFCIRSKANSEYVLAVAQHGLTEKGQVWMWRKPNMADVDVYCQWVVGGDGSIRCKADPACCLCPAQHGYTDGGEVWIWPQPGTTD